MKKWHNTSKVVDMNILKPCKTLGYCPYGSLVEYYPLQGKNRDDKSCRVFGHDCPVFYQKENFVDLSPQQCVIN